MDHSAVLKTLGFTQAELTGGTLSVVSPIDGDEVARLRETPISEMPAVIAQASQRFERAYASILQGGES